MHPRLEKQFSTRRFVTLFNGRDVFQWGTGVANPRVSRPTRAAQTVIAGDYGLTTASIAWIPHAGGF